MTPWNRIIVLYGIELERNEYIAPRNETEWKRCETFAQVLNLSANRMGIRADIIAPGGDSIRSMRAVLLAGINGPTTQALYRGWTPEKNAAELSGRNVMDAFAAELNA